MRNKQEIADYITHYMRDSGISKTALGAHLGAEGINQKKVQKATQFLNPKTNKIDLESLRKTADFLGVHPAQILLKPKEWQVCAQQLQHLHLHKDHLVPLIKPGVIPRLNVTADEIQEWVVLPWVSHPGKYIAVTVPDDAIYGLQKGGIAFVDTRLHRHTLQGAVVLFSCSKAWGFRRFTRGEGGTLFFHADDKENYPDQSCNHTEEVNMVGVVTHSLSQFVGASSPPESPDKNT